MPRQTDSQLMSFEEIGENLGISADDAKYIYIQGIKKLARFLRARPQLAEDLFITLENQPLDAEVPLQIRQILLDNEEFF